MESQITTEEWDLIHDLVNKYYTEHSKLVNSILDELPEDSRADLQGELLMLMNERNSVYGRDTEAKHGVSNKGTSQESSRQY